MDLLLQCAQNFEHLIPYQYHMVIGRKGKMLDFTVSFDKADFHHLAGLHKLRDNVRFQTGKRSDIMTEILEGRLTLSTASQSAFFQEMEPRLSPLAGLEHFLDSNEIIFRYNAKANTFSAIKADYLLQNDHNGNPVYLFLAQRTGEKTLGCRTFFPKSEKDHAQGQPRYTLLKKEKTCLSTGETVMQYDRLTPKE
ncbi:MAG: PBECR4 domain-containing protein [Bacteroidales bacterium]|nr:PBECR4 domain-containing protein [Bacteroidales bacterium]MCM1416597.1 PBECR4 domain-containing protein [bacterium]MCM1424819.1 PBECR4 domain-containing protein [bacterium]